MTCYLYYGCGCEVAYDPDVDQYYMENLCPKHSKEVEEEIAYSQEDDD